MQTSKFINKHVSHNTAPRNDKDLLQTYHKSFLQHTVITENNGGKGETSMAQQGGVVTVETRFFRYGKVASSGIIHNFQVQIEQQ